MTAGSDLQPTSFITGCSDADPPFTVLGTGAVGGKAAGLQVLCSKVLPELDLKDFPGFEVGVPGAFVLSADVCETFLAENDLLGMAVSGAKDLEIAAAFQEATFPAGIVEELRAEWEKLSGPLVVRSSSMLEQEMGRPCPGIYATKLVPNNEKEPEDRFAHLCQAIQYVYASVMLSSASTHAARAGRAPGSDRLAVIVQEVLGRQRGERFYPTISGAASTYNYYPIGDSNPEDGVVSLALGLGKTIVDGGRCWSYCPTVPRRPPPFLGTKGLLKSTQTKFWTVNLKKPLLVDAKQETEYLESCSIDVALADGALRHIASTYDAESDRLSPGAEAPGAKVLDFAPLLGSGDIPLNDLVRRILALAEKAVGSPVEIEFAVNLDPERGLPARLGLLQLRPTALSHEEVALEEADLQAGSPLLASTRTMGNGSFTGIHDVVFVKPKDLDPVHTRLMAYEVEGFDRALRTAGRPYLLIGVGRWGTQDPWVGIPVTWNQICGARVIVEATVPQMSPEPSQGAHFFQSMVAAGALYLAVRHDAPTPIDWDWLDQQETVAEGRHIKHVRCASALNVLVDGRTGRGVVRREG